MSILGLMSKVEQEKYFKWAKKQYKLCQKKHDGYHGAIGGEETFHITPTSLGLVIKVENSCSGDIVDVTDYGSW